MNNRVVHYGEKVFDFLAITIILNLSMILVLPFVPMVFGVHLFLVTTPEQRSLKQLFVPLRDNPRVVLYTTFFLLLVVSVGYLNLYYLEITNTFVMWLIHGTTYIILFVALLVFINGPTIQNHMTVSFRQLLYNSLTLPLGGIIHTLTSIGILTIYVYGASRHYLFLVFGIPFAMYFVANLSYSNLLKLKERLK